ncbi:hypothetical protein Ae201684P_012273 [Aphanomyces euteiches]|uniref:Uncharacterized protein n=1 Tax=Aphanomyces euteiches TaxID=100861 RepID=A0A6G0W4P8_9STRA|nr:hypothetical protein Ae201684_018776 [Aphanomyces euteiches]KAH9088986.1 hypothetical protein Ae201684P_012273 [Aphanomyces euteiches]
MVLGCAKTDRSFHPSWTLLGTIRRAMHQIRRAKTRSTRLCNNTINTTVRGIYYANTPNALSTRFISQTRGGC